MRNASLFFVSALLFTACGGTESGDSSGGGSAPSKNPTFEVASTSFKLAPGQETYRCWSTKTPADGGTLQLTEMEVSVPKEGVHHWAMFTNSAPVPSDPVGYDCIDMSATWGLVAAGGIGTPAPKFPDGAAMKVKPGQHVVFQLHMFNTTDHEIDVEPAKLNMIGASPDVDLLPVGFLITGTLDIALPPQSKDVTVTGGCNTKFPLQNVFAVFPHMHQLGRRIVTEVTPQGGETKTISDLTWNFSDQGLYPVAGSVAQGDSVKVTCHFDNPNSEEVKFGEGSKDEMCISVLLHYPAPEGPTSHYCGLAGDI